eukprot:7484003-Pyramimonas_sp.AAC.1
MFGLWTCAQLVQFSSRVNNDGLFGRTAVLQIWGFHRTSTNPFDCTQSSHTGGITHEFTQAVCPCTFSCICQAAKAPH